MQYFDLVLSFTALFGLCAFLTLKARLHSALAPLTALGPKIEHNDFFSEGVNVEFVQVLGEGELRMRVWERGSGVTMACGTGACASAAAAVKKRFCRAGEPISVHLDGGTLEIAVASDYGVTMTGPAEFVYEGDIA